MEPGKPANLLAWSKLPTTSTQAVMVKHTTRRRVTFNYIRKKTVRVYRIDTLHDLLTGNRSFTIDCFGKQNVVLEMNVLVKILFKSFECFVQSFVADANIWRNCIIA